ncbi:MAG: NAD(P)H-hydrate epimerase [Candidatus Omnitrophica bacterium]|nr:NAD(P)H-hydrate epimerase [Candidatus Omnitrophota bacterium]
MKTVTSKRMKQLDMAAQEVYGIPSVVLMENAGGAAAREIKKFYRKGSKASVFCGKGNNGGDGFVCARYLALSGIETEVFLLARYQDVKNTDPLINLDILNKMGIPVKGIITKSDVERLKTGFRCDFIVDAIFGIGFKGDLPEHIGEVISFLNHTRKPVFSLDVPSGLDATSGIARGACVKARKTIAFGFAKTGFFRKDGPFFSGRIIVKDIGLPFRAKRS